MPFRKIRDINIYYEISGQGPKLEFFQGGHDFYNHDPLAYQHIANFLLANADDS